jgi:hypothetical protein
MSSRAYRLWRLSTDWNQVFVWICALHNIVARKSNPPLPGGGCLQVLSASDLTRRKLAHGLFPAAGGCRGAACILNRLSQNGLFEG